MVIFCCWVFSLIAKVKDDPFAFRNMFAATVWFGNTLKSVNERVFPSSAFNTRCRILPVRLLKADTVGQNEVWHQVRGGLTLCQMDSRTWR
jgi:hypothetical protein